MLQLKKIILLQSGRIKLIFFPVQNAQTWQPRAPETEASNHAQTKTFQG